MTIRQLQKYISTELMYTDRRKTSANSTYKKLADPWINHPNSYRDWG